MEALEERVLAASRDRAEIERLLRDYQPFLRKQAAPSGAASLLQRF